MWGRREGMSYWVVVYRFAIVLVAIFVVFALICLFLPKCHRYQELQRRKLALSESNAKMESRVRQLESNQTRFETDPEFVERVARQQGMAKPGETIFKMTGDGK